MDLTCFLFFWITAWPMVAKCYQPMKSVKWVETLLKRKNYSMSQWKASNRSKRWERLFFYKIKSVIGPSVSWRFRTYAKRRETYSKKSSGSRPRGIKRLTKAVSIYSPIEIKYIYNRHFDWLIFLKTESFWEIPQPHEGVRDSIAVFLLGRSRRSQQFIVHSNTHQ